MNKAVLLGIAAFGGLVLISLVLPDTPATNEQFDNSVITATAQIPSDIPSVPVYTNATVVSAGDTDTANSRDISLSLSTTDEIAAINDWYREALSSNGWSIKSDKNVAGYQIIQGEKDNLYTSMQAANGVESGTVTISQHIKIRNTTD